MKASKKPPRYTTEQINEITDRIITLRTRWLRLVKDQLASRQSRFDRSAEVDEYIRDPNADVAKRIA
jgi:hypothetical protein